MRVAPQTRKGAVRVTERPKSREETPKGGLRNRQAGLTVTKLDVRRTNFKVLNCAAHAETATSFSKHHVRTGQAIDNERLCDAFHHVASDAATPICKFRIALAAKKQKKRAVSMNGPSLGRKRLPCEASPGTSGQADRNEPVDYEKVWSCSRPAATPEACVTCSCRMLVFFLLQCVMRATFGRQSAGWLKPVISRGTLA